MNGFLQITLRGFAVILGLVLVTTVVGTIYQYLSEVADLKRFPPPGRLVDIGGRKLHLLCAGSETGPSVVIEAGSGNDSTLWEHVVRRISAFARVCTYDRAGLGWSDPAPGSRSFDDRAEDLNALLTAAHIPSPYILVGHSYGGYLVRCFAALHPSSVVGVVLVEAPEEEFTFALDGLQDIDGGVAQASRLGWLTRIGFWRTANALFPNRADPVKGVPDDVHALMTALALRTSRHFARADEMASYRKVPASWREAGGFGLLGNTPLVVISAPRSPDAELDTSLEWREGQQRLTRISTAATHVFADKPGHAVQFSDPDVISEAIRRLLSRVAANDHG